MALSGFEPTPLEEPPTERVGSGRRAAVAVVVVAVVVIGTFVWKPWGAGSGAPATTRPAASLSAVAAGPSRAPVIAPVAPEQTPATAPLTDPGPQMAAAPNDLGGVSLDAGGDAFVHCTYSGGTPPKLMAMVVSPPAVTAGDAVARGEVKRVTYRPEIEANSLEGIFSAEWSFVKAGGAQRSALRHGGASFRPVQIKVDVAKLPTSAVLRIAVVINWVGTDGSVLATQRLYPTSYAALSTGSADPIPEGCPASN